MLMLHIVFYFKKIIHQMLTLFSKNFGPFIYLCQMHQIALKEHHFL